MTAADDGTPPADVERPDYTDSRWPGLGESDLANARFLVARHGHMLRYVVPWKRWMLWDGKRWALDETGEVYRRAKNCSDMLRAWPDPGRPARPGQAARPQVAPGIRAMVALAETEPTIAIAPAALDADPYLINVENGTLDLRTGELRAHDPADLLTKLAGAAYRPDAKAPAFDAFLERVQPDPAMREFLARLFGHAALGKVVEHVLAVLYGQGANGKSVLVETVARVFGDYARPIDPNLLIERRSDAHPAGIAALFGVRLAVTHETDEGRRLAEGTVKRLTGGDTITARRMREDFWDFTPSHSIVMHTNHRPIVRGNDEGIWRRLRFVPFNVVIPAAERDRELAGRLALEAAGVLGWIINGYRQWQSAGLASPPPVEAATSEFREESDMLGLFLDERCVIGRKSHVRSAELFAEWVAWCKGENAPAGKQTTFSLELSGRGFDKQRDNRGYVWQGIGLKADEWLS